MEIIERYNCRWSVDRYSLTAEECKKQFLIYHNRVRLTCIESNNQDYPVGSFIDYSEPAKF